jgi:hypothetical protein
MTLNNFALHLLPAMASIMRLKFIGDREQECIRMRRDTGEEERWEKVDPGVAMTHSGMARE